MNILATDVDARINSVPEDAIYSAIVACIRAVANNRHLSITVGASEDSTDSEFDLPTIADRNKLSSLVLLRGLSDSFSMMRIHHDSDIHYIFSPLDSTADRLFTLLERERFEELGSREFQGVAYNLMQLWTLSHGQDALQRFGGAEHLEFIISCLCREAISDKPLPDSVMKFLIPLREPVDKLVGVQIKALKQLVADQTQFARQSLEIIRCLGFDISPRSDAKPEDGEELAQASDDIDEEAESESSQEKEDEANASESTETSPAETPVNETETVRNPDHEDDTEPEELDANTLPPDTLAVSTLSGSLRGEQRYRVFDKNNDEVCPASSLGDAEKRLELRKILDKHINLYAPHLQKLTRRLQRVLVSKQRVFWQPNQDEGELDPQRVSNIIVCPNSALAYRIQTEENTRDCAVTLLIDNSRSMLGKPIISAAICADVVTRVLERCGASAEVLGFTTVNMYGGSVAQIWKDQGCPANAGRLNNTRHIIYKSARSSWKQSRNNFGLMLDPDILKQNIDGEALLWAYGRLQKRPESRRILMIMSDGRPSDSYTTKANANNYLVDHLQRVVKHIEKQADVDLVAIGLGHEVIETYQRSLLVDDLTHLAPTIMNELTGLLAH